MAEEKEDFVYVPCRCGRRLIVFPVPGQATKVQCFSCNRQFLILVKGDLTKEQIKRLKEDFDVREQSGRKEDEEEKDDEKGDTD